MSSVLSHAAPTPISSTPKSHDCIVGRGSLACHRSNQNAAATETANCMNRIGRA